MREEKDFYFYRAKEEGYLARSVYKLKEANDRYHFLRAGYRVLDLGAYPGSWSQYAIKVVGNAGLVVGVDLSAPKVTAPNFVPITCDIYADIEGKISQFLPFSVVLSDMAPATTGHKEVDHLRSISLCERALQISLWALKEGGDFFCKVFQGGEFNNFLTLCRKSYKTVRIFKPKSSRKESVEIFVLCVGKKL